MIVASILLILVAVALLVAGLADGSSPLLITSIAVSLLAAVALVARTRQVAATQATAEPPTRRRQRTRPGPAGAPAAPGLGEPDIPAQHGPHTAGTGGSGWRQPPEPPVTDPARTSPATGGPFDGEPPAQALSAAEVARLARLDAEVRVVDGHPRFHLPGCPHLVGRADEPLPVAEAVGLGFSSCGRCAPATALLGETRGAGS